jgi:hypothetical protein
MLFLRLEAISRYVGGILLIGMGILVSLFVVTRVGGAVPASSYELNPNFMNGSPPAYIIESSLDSNVQPPVTIVLDTPLTLHEPAVLPYTEWHPAPIKAWSWIAAAGVVITGILYLLLRRMRFGMSEEIFP